MLKLWFLTITLCATLTAIADELPFRFTCLPYLQNVTDSEATIIWATDRDAVSWVEVAPDDDSHFYAEERPKYFSTTLGKKDIGTMHRITISGLKPATKYRYRVYSKEVTKNADMDTRYGRTIANDVYRGRPFRFSTMNPDEKSLHFAVVNDIHEDAERYGRLFHQVDSASLDFMVLNGDMVNNMNTIEQPFDGYLNTSSRLFATSMPFYMVRGNHETRGTQSQRYMSLYSTPTGKPYYAIRRGDVCFVVLDAGEDKPDSDIEYNNLAAFDQYRTEEAQWLKETVESDMFTSAPLRIVFIHVPPGGRAWHGQIEVNEKFIPILNNAGVDLMISGHLHEHKFHKKGSDGLGFPLLINSNMDILDINAGDNAIDVMIIDDKGNLKKQLRFTPNR